jgi:hypothetical protein
VPHDVRDQVVDFVRRWSEKTEISVGRFPQWLGIGASKFYDWRQRYGRVNEHNSWIPRDFWLSVEQLDKGLEKLSDPTYWAMSPLMVAVRGRCPALQC